jgi:hypothetical protein
MNNEPWKIRKAITKVLHVVDEKNGGFTTTPKNVSEKCFKFHGRYRVEGESQDLEINPEKVDIQHHDAGTARFLQKHNEDIWSTEHTPSPVMIGTYKQYLLSKKPKGFGWPSTNSDQFYSPKLGISQKQMNKRITALNAKIYWEDVIGSYKINCSEQHKEDSKDLEYEINSLDYDRKKKQELINAHIGCPKNHKGKTAVLDLYCNGGDRTIDMITGLVPESANKLEVSTWPIYNSYPSWSCGINGTEAYTNPILAISTVEENELSANQYSKIGHEHLTFTDLDSCQDKYLELAKKQIDNDQSGFFMTKNLEKISIQAVILRLIIVFCVGYLVYRGYLTVTGKKKNKKMRVKEREASIQHQNVAVAGSLQRNIIMSSNVGTSIPRTEQCDLTSESGNDQLEM